MKFSLIHHYSSHLFIAYEKKKAIIDIGTNSIKFCVAQIMDSENYSIIVDTVHITRIGEHLYQTGLISIDAMKRNVDKINELSLKAHQLGADDICAVGTMALRKAKNADIFIKRIKEKCNLDIRILSGDDEARITYQAAISSIKTSPVNTVVFDSGGGSTEFTFGWGQEIKKRISIDIGAVLITEKFFCDDPVKPEQLSLAQDHIVQQFRKYDLSGPVDQLIGLGGAVTTMAAVKHKMNTFDPGCIQGTLLSRQDVAEQMKAYSSQPLEKRKTIPGLQPGREDIILAGACIINGIMLQLRCNSLIVCNRGLRHGLII
ncbi:MAG: Ppx/GppA family phosphatase [Candidatus Magnetomorum sp.]|nr:Ppx/GppA family phosphatase [Candidatus Magnetomorum sp.]